MTSPLLLVNFRIDDRCRFSPSCTRRDCSYCKSRHCSPMGVSAGSMGARSREVGRTGCEGLPTCQNGKHRCLSKRSSCRRVECNWDPGHRVILHSPFQSSPERSADRGLSRPSYNRVPCCTSEPRDRESPKWKPCGSPRHKQLGPGSHCVWFSSGNNCLAFQMDIWALVWLGEVEWLGPGAPCPAPDRGT